MLGWMATERNKSQHLWAAWRDIVARRDGYRCFYCKVPTGATLEHVDALHNDGKSEFENLRLACPWCNSKKGSTPVDEFLATEGWKLPIPELPATLAEMLLRFYNKELEPEMTTGVPNAQLHVKNGIAIALVRTHKRSEWQVLPLGPQDHPKVIRASWDFLARHNTRRSRLAA